jgi:transcriptional regulator with XRE-family HTH domain
MLRALPPTLKRLGVTQGELAEQIGVRQETVSRWVNDHSTPGADSLLAILSFLQRRDPSVTLTDLTGTGAAA